MSLSMTSWASLTPTQRQEHVRGCVMELGTVLGRELHIDVASFDRIRAGGFSIHVRDVGESLDRVRAIVGAQPVAGRLYVRSWVFYYLSGRRVAPSEGECAEYEMRASDDVWHFCGWQAGEFDEFDEFLTYEAPSP